MVLIRSAKLILPLAVVWLVSCQRSSSTSSAASFPTPELSAQEDTAIRKMGDSLTAQRQQLLLQRLLAAAEKEGWGGAVRYCHLASETLAFYRSDTLFLQRIAQRYRDPKNALSDSLDQSAFTYYEQTHDGNAIIWQVGTQWRYYRPIYIQLSTCLKCHGPKEDLDALALTEIRKHYPGDKATGFRMGELRGLWRMVRTPAP